MLSEWLRGGNDPRREWGTLAAALRTKQVDLVGLAEEIEKKYRLVVVDGSEPQGNHFIILLNVGKPPK